MTVEQGDPRLLPFIGDVIARIVTAREALGVCDLPYAAELLRDLELDLAAWKSWREEQAA